MMLIQVPGTTWRVQGHQMSKDMGKSKGIKQNKIHEILLFRQFRKKIWFYSYGFNMCRNLALGDTVIFKLVEDSI